LPGAIPDQELVFEDKRLRNDGTDAARTEQPSQDGNEMDEKNGQLAHRRMVAGRGILRNLGRNNNSPATACTAVVGSLTAGDKARMAMSTSNRGLRFVPLNGRRLPAIYSFYFFGTGTSVVLLPLARALPAIQLAVMIGTG
jgi:hypothetical protein